jgi:hypothetical protein
MAVQSHNEQAVMEILGGEKDLVSSGDESEDKLDHERFAQKYQEMHRLVREPDGSEFIYIGAENWPFPVPLVLRAGTWRFDGDRGKREILFRRIGEDEVSAIETCRALVTAVKHRVDSKVAGDDPVAQYADSLVRAARTDNPSNGQVSAIFRGYSFRVLPAPAGKGQFTFIAYPAEYRSSGVMTFAVANDGVVYESDLGPDTVKAANAITTWKPDSSWYVAE